MHIKGEKVTVRKLIREDVDKMQHWAMHDDPLYFHYNFPKLNEAQKVKWYKIKTTKFKKKSFAIENKEGEIVGYLSIRNIKWIKRESELGIVLDAKHMNKGYGTEALVQFLNYYFQHLKMKSIILRTAKFNKRAIRCYSHCGFKITKVCMEEFEDQYAEIFYNPKYQHLKKLFTIVDGKKMTEYLHMRVTKDEFYEKIHDLSTEICV